MTLQEALAGCLWLHVDDTKEPWPFEGTSATQVRWPDVPVTDEQVVRAKRVVVKHNRWFVIWSRETTLPDPLPPEWERSADYISAWQDGKLSVLKARDIGVDHFLDLLLEARA